MSGSIIRHHGVKQIAGQIKIYGDPAKRSEESYYPEGVVADDEKRNGTIYCNGSVVFSGSGSLQITGKKHWTATEARTSSSAAELSSAQAALRSRPPLQAHNGL